MVVAGLLSLKMIVASLLSHKIWLLLSRCRETRCRGFLRLKFVVLLLVAKAFLRCRFVVVAKPKNCRMPSSGKVTRLQMVMMMTTNTTTNYHPLEIATGKCNADTGISKNILLWINLLSILCFLKL